MKKLAVLTVAAALTWSAAPTSAQTAPNADTTRATVSEQSKKNKKCVTRKEYRQVKKKMKLKKVARIIGGKGRLLSSSDGMKVRRHEACKGSPYYASVTYKRGRVYTKYGFFR